MPDDGTEHRKLAAIMFTDMVGYSALVQRNEALALELLEEHHRLLRPVFPKFGGREIKSTGDGFLVEFASALSAAQCAIEIQKTLVQYNAAAGPERRYQVRIGVHLGDVVLREADIFGDGVNIAARIEPLAEAGGICLSRSVFDQVANKLDAALVKLGSPELKNIQVPMEVYRVVLPWQAGGVAPARRALSRQQAQPRWGWMAAGLAGLAVLGVVVWLRWPAKRQTQAPGPAGPAASARSVATLPATNIAILPFRNLGLEKENEYFAEGLSEQLLSKLQNIGGLSVIPVSGTNYLSRELGELGREFGVGSVLKGSASKAENEVRVHVELVHAESRRVLWADDFQKEFKHIFAIQDEVARQVAAALKVRLLPTEEAQLAKRPTENLEAYALYLQGRKHWNRMSRDGFQQAIRLYGEAIKKDPKYALAHAGLADCYTLMAFDLEPPAKMYGDARRFAEMAAALDDSLAQAHVSLGMVRAFFEWEWGAAEGEFKRALELQETYADAHHYYAHWLEVQGRWAEVHAQWERARQLGPASLQISQETGLAYYMNEEYDRAIAICQRAVQTAPTFIYAKSSLAMAYSQKGQYLAAIKETTEARALPDGDIPTVVAELGYAYAKNGDRANAEALLRQMRQQRASGVYVDPWWLAVIHAGLGQTEQALDELEHAVAERSASVCWVNVEPKFKSLRAAPRFKELLKKVKLE